MRHKQITALLLSAMVAVSSCMPAGAQAFAAEVSAVGAGASRGSAAEENAGQALEGDQGSEDAEIAAADGAGVSGEAAEVSEEATEDAVNSAEAEAEADADAEGADVEGADTDAEGADAESADVDAEGADADVEGADAGEGSELAAENATAEVAAEEEPAAGTTTGTAVDSAAGKTAAEAKAGEQEEIELPMEVEDGVVDDTRNDALGALAKWDAEKLASLPVLETDVSSASDGCVLLGLPGEYIAAQQAVLDRINEIRKEACEEGVENPDTGNPLTPDDYVPLKWSYELEEIARIRVAESSMTAYHVRANGNSWQSLESDFWYLGEEIAWNYSRSATFGIEQWYGEKKTWVNGGSGVTGHYTWMIRPSMRHVGGATFYSPYTYYPNATLIEFSAEEGLDESFVDMTGECIQMIEVNESNLSGDSSILGTCSGVKGDEQKLFLTTGAKYSGAFDTDTEGLLFMDGVNWSSSNSKVASVSTDGTVKAVKCGSATITATADNGMSATAEFTVDHVLQKIPAVEATCTKTGLTEGEKCANCGLVTVKQEMVAAKGHSYGSWTVTKKATCTTAGSRKKTCSACGNVVTESIAATGHKWETDYTVDKAATCTAEGSESIHCSVCDAIDESTVRAIAKTAHTYGAWKVTKKATCTTKGSKQRVCTVCGNKQTQSIAATGHKWETEYTVDKAATCAEEGSESIHCSVCDAINESTVRAIAKTAHTYGAWTVTKEPTCTAKGTKEKVCTACGDKVTQTIAATGHTYGAWKVTKQPTCTSKGSKQRVCTKCGNKQTQAIPMLTPGWKQDANGWKYLRSDTTYPKSQFEVIDGKTYYFNDSEYRVTGLQEIDGAKYFFNEEGVMQTGWQTIDGEKYYFDESGEAHIGWLEYDGNWYYFRLTGVMHTGTLKKDGLYYYLRKDGTRLSGWLKVGSNLYYFKKNGVRLTGWLKLNGKMYYFKTNGVRHTGWLKLNGRYFYFKPENGQMVTGRYKIGSTWFTFNSNGVRQ